MKGDIPPPDPHVVMAVRNPCVHDARVRKEAASLAGAGYRVTVIALQTGDLPAIESQSGWTVVRRVRVPLHPGSQRGTSRHGLVRLVWKAVRSTVYHLRLRREILDHAPDIIHAHDLDTLLGAGGAARAAGVPLVYDAHELFTEMTTLSGTGRRVGRILERCRIRQAARVLTVNRSIARELSLRYGTQEPAVVRDCPPDPGPLKKNDGLRFRTGTGPGTLLVLYHGGFTPGRGLETLAAAFRDAQDAALVMMGWGPLKSGLVRECERLGLSNRIHFLPPVPPEALLPLVAGADLGIIPYVPVSLNNRLSLPNKVFEFLAAGVPVLASDLPEISALLRETGAGLVYPAGDHTSLSRALQSLAASPESLHRLRVNATRSRPAVTWEPEAKKLLDLYRTLIPARGGSTEGHVVPIHGEDESNRV